ncbi:MAG: PGF-CTERM sorting domain-containing protein [Candidatus Methanoperedens sp.]|nr:PGF-CTERM sorting domain-containing protein [Candidatus Methanoperedens sp.]MCZ7405682.1 PGF-CTERM sorting domain-containing protein [Candidatus Methanoperedens sp.]
MNRKTAVILLLLTLVILAGAPESFARPQYLTNLTTVYGGGTCGTCHVIASGMRNSSMMFGQNNSNGTYVPRNTSRTPGQRRTNGTFGMRNPTNRTLPLNSYGILFENQPGHATDPGTALMAIGQPPAATGNQGDTPADTAATGTKAAPGFGIVLSLIGLFACVLLARRRNK